jgi:hypothetical protein
MSVPAIVWIGAVVATALIGWWLLRARRQARAMATGLPTGEDIPEIGRDHREAQRWLEENNREGHHDSGADHGGSDGGDGD